VKAYVASTKGMLTLHFLPGYAPELNPDELVWSHMKRTAAARREAAGKKIASSEESVGDVRLRQFAKCMVQRGFRDVEGAEAVGFRMVSLALLLRPSTTPLEYCFLARK
jgi:hypothetical protein